MNDLTNIAVVTTDEDFSELYCSTCAAELFTGAANKEVTPRYTWEDNGTDSPNHCPECGVLLEEDLTDFGYDYVREAVLEQLQEGNTLALDSDSPVGEWHARWGSEINNGEDTDEILDAAAVLQGYLECLVWTGTLDFMTGTAEHGGECLTSDGVLDSVLDVESLRADIVESATADVDNFLEQVGEYLKYWELPESLTASQLGHDFCLTRNHHGAGFWDRGYGELGAWLTRVSEAMGSQSLYGAVVMLDARSESLENSNLDLSTLTYHLEG
jgi:hypothetical protein